MDLQSGLRNDFEKLLERLWLIIHFEKSSFSRLYSTSGWHLSTTNSSLETCTIRFLFQNNGVETASPTGKAYYSTKISKYAPFRPTPNYDPKRPIVNIGNLFEIQNPRKELRGIQYYFWLFHLKFFWQDLFPELRESKISLIVAILAKSYQQSVPAGCTMQSEVFTEKNKEKVLNKVLNFNFHCTPLNSI